MPLIQMILDDEFLESVVYVGETEKYPTVAGFLCEFLSMVKLLPNDLKAEVCRTLRNHNFGSLSLIFLQGLFTEHFDCQKLQKNMILGHLELLFFTFRKDMDYCRDSLAKQPSFALLAEHIMLYADSSTYAYFC